MSEARPDSRVGSRFGHHRLRRLLGRGGMGEVYEAYDTVKDRVVALKLVSEQVGSDDLFRRRMQREAQTAGRLQEPHIVPIHDYGEVDGQLFIDMRFIEGKDVGAVLNRTGPLPRRARWQSSSKSLPHSMPPTAPGSSIATSNPKTSCSPRATSPTWWTLVSPRRPPTSVSPKPVVLWVVGTTWHRSDSARTTPPTESTSTLWPVFCTNASRGQRLSRPIASAV